MPNTVKYNPGTGIIELSVEGAFTFDDAASLLENTVNEFQKCKCYLLLIDYRKAELKLNTFELYSLAEQIAETIYSLNLPFYKLKRALIAGTETTDYNFLETLSVNRGQRICVFNNTNEAIEWLQKDNSTS